MNQELFRHYSIKGPEQEGLRSNPEVPYSVRVPQESVTDDLPFSVTVTKVVAKSRRLRWKVATYESAFMLYDPEKITEEEAMAEVKEFYEKSGPSTFHSPELEEELTKALIKEVKKSKNVMCTTSMIMDNWRDRHPEWVQDPGTASPGTTAPWPPQGEPLATQRDLEGLREEIVSLKKLLIAATIYDAETGQPNCEMAEKVAMIRRLAEMVGNDLDDIFGEEVK